VRPKSYAPQHRVTSSAVDKPSSYSAELAGDNTEAWEARSRPLVAFLRTGGKTSSEIRKWARSEGHAVTMTEEALYWLLAQNRVVRELGVWRVVRK
jgi:hypothetical protein